MPTRDYSPFRRSAGRRSSERAHFRAEHGQASVLLVAVIAAALVAVVAFAQLGSRLGDEAAAQAAADSVALATLHGPEPASELAAWYRSAGIAVDVDRGRALATAGDQTARAVATVEVEVSPGQPVFHAVVARVEQLVGASLASARVESDAIVVSHGDAQLLRRVAAEFGLCAQVRRGPTVRFTWCAG